jgi:hypothetical protein
LSIADGSDVDQLYRFTPSTGLSFKHPTLTNGLFGFGNDFKDGEAVRFAAPTGSSITNLVSGNTYYIRDRQDNSFKLAATENGTAIDGLVSSGNGLFSLTPIGYKSDLLRGENWQAWGEQKAGSLNLSVRELSSAELENLLPFGYIQKSVGITLEKNTTLLGNEVNIEAKALDLTLAETLGQQGTRAAMLDGAGGMLSSLLALPVKAIQKNAGAKIVINEGSVIRSIDSLMIKAEAKANASGKAISQLFSLGYTGATATADVQIKSGADLKSGGPLVIESSGTSIADIKTATERSEDFKVPSVIKSAAGSAGISRADLTSSVTIANSARVYGGRTVNIRALGEQQSGLQQ